MTATLETITFRSFTINFEPRDGEKVVAICINTASRSTLRPYVFNFLFQSGEAAIEYVTKWIEGKAKNMIDREDAKIRKRTAKASYEHSYKAGDILINSWGYDQTNADFYQVVSFKQKSIIIRPIAGKMVEGSQEFMSCRMVPVADDFIGEALTKVVQVYVNSVGTAVGYLSMSHGTLVIYDKGDKGAYCSWDA